MISVVAGGLATTANAESVEMTGYAGVLGEWELTASLTPTASDQVKEFVGPLKMRHVGYCTQSGPEEKEGEIRVRLSGPATARLTATLVVNGVECSFSGRQSDAYTGSLKCPDRRAVPLILWLR
jgi:hypothetical protein